jgi:hypothetical protein
VEGDRRFSAAESPGLCSGKAPVGPRARPRWYGWHRALWDGLLVVAVAGLCVVAWRICEQSPLRTPGGLGGQVVDLGNRPIAGAVVAVEGAQRLATTDANGSFHLADLPPGDHWIVVEVRGQAGIRLKVTVLAGRDLLLGEMRKPGRSDNPTIRVQEVCLC